MIATAQTLFHDETVPGTVRTVRIGDRIVRYADLTRRDLAKVFAELAYTYGAEIGVWQGAYSIELCQANPNLRLLCVDPWLSYPEWIDRKNSRKYAMEAIYRDACNALAPYRCTIRRGLSKDVAPTIPDGSLDFVYIDGNHVYAAVMEDLTLWAPKVRRGGIVAGHDYRQYEKQPEIEVEQAVNVFTAKQGISPLVVFAGDRCPSFAWMVR